MNSLIEYLSVKIRQELFILFIFILYLFSDISLHRRLDFRKEHLFLFLNNNYGLKILIKIRVTKI